MTAHELPVSRPIAVKAFVMFGVGHLDINAQPQTQAIALDALLEHAGATHQNRLGQLFIYHNLYGTQDALILAFCKDDSVFTAIMYQAFGQVVNGTHKRTWTMDKLAELIHMRIKIIQGPGAKAHIP